MLRPITVALGRQVLFQQKRALSVAALSSGSAFWRTTSLPAAAVSARFLSSVTVPPPPTSNHPHTPLPNASGSIVYTETDEAPALATYSLYPYIAKVDNKTLLFLFLVSRSRCSAERK